MQKLCKTFFGAGLMFMISMPLMPLMAQNMAFGTNNDIAFGNALWQALERSNLVGDNAIMARPYEGQQPHGMKLVTLEAEVTVNGERNEVIIKHNFGGEGATVEAVSNNPAQYLAATTVMFRRAGFDAEHGDWFWAKYLPDGSYDKAPNGTSLVGKAAGCIACHGTAPGGDMVFLNDRY